jgi:hypothetical protein
VVSGKMKTSLLMMMTVTVSRATLKLEWRRLLLLHRRGQVASWPDPGWQIGKDSICTYVVTTSLLRRSVTMLVQPPPSRS